MRFFLRCFLSEIKKCVAEATHRKMHSSHCCYTSFPHTIVRYAEKEHAFLPKVKTAHLYHVNNINLCSEYIIIRNNNFVNILKRKTADRIIVGSFLNFISLNLCAIIAWPSIATAYGSFTPFSPGRIARSVTDPYHGGSNFGSLSSAVFYACALILPKDGHTQKFCWQDQPSFCHYTGDVNRQIILYSKFG